MGGPADIPIPYVTLIATLSAPPKFSLPTLPAVRLQMVRPAPASSHPFLEIERVELQLATKEGPLGGRFVYDHVRRKALDAVVIVVHSRDSAGQHVVYMRSALRPPLALRAPPLEPCELGLWELPAGLIEPNELPEAAASRESLEELGLDIAPERFSPLGAHSYPAPGVIGEKHVYLHAEVPWDTPRVTPTEDGSPLEKEALICLVPVLAALEISRAGGLHDAKTELAIRRRVDWGEAT